MKKSIIILLFAFLSLSIFSQNLISTQPHNGRVTSGAFSPDGSLFTVGEDGFVIKWGKDNQGEHYQVSDLQIKLISTSPNGTDIAIYETDGYSINRISIWNWKTKKRIVVKRITDTVTTINFSQKGTYLMVGTNSVNGIIFLNAKTGTVVRKVKEAPGMVSMIYSSNTENSGVMYTPLGKLIYTNLKTGVTKQTISVESNLDQPTLFNNDLFFAGIKNNYIYVFHSVTGDLLTKQNIKNATLISNRNDSNLFFLVPEGRNYVLKMFQTDLTSINETPVIIKTIYPEARPKITFLTKDSLEVVALCDNGTVQKTSVEPNTTISSMENISKAMYDKIFDIAVKDDNFYFLTSKSVFSSSYTNSEITTVAKNNGFTNFLTYNNSLIFYSKNKASSIVISNLETFEESQLYKANNPIQAVHLKDQYMLVIEGSSKVVLIDIENKSSKVVYTGVGIQDAILYTPTDIYVAKTAASTPNSALIHVNVNTQETVIVPMNGEVAFSLSQSTNKNVFYGVCVYSGTTKRTDIFAYYPENKHYAAVFQWGDEDTEAFTVFKNNFLYTNIGKTQIQAVNLSTRKSTNLQRFVSLPQKLDANSSLMVVLNKDGSISWYNAKTNSLYANWYVTVEGNWIEY